MLEHRGHDVRLRDGLPLANRQRVIFVGVLPKRLRYELVPWHFAHGVKHPPVADAALGNLRANHFFALRSSVHRSQFPV
jgi:hypothetical protein